MRFKKTAAAVVICAAIVMNLAGCGKEETSAPANTSTSTTSSTSQQTSSTPQSTSSTTEESSTSEESSAPEQSAANEADFEWKENRDGGVIITAYKGSDENVIIPSTLGGKTVDEIDYSAFKGNIDITSVTIPASVEFIWATNIFTDDGGAFSDCINLSEVNFLGDTPNFTLAVFYNTPWLEAQLAESTEGFTIIGNALVYADLETTGTDVVIPNGVTQINVCAFNTNNGGPGSELTSISIPDSVTKIASYAFYSCYKLTSINIPDSVVEIGVSAFFECSSLNNIDIPNGVTTIEECTFSRCSGVINLPDTVTSIDSRAFSDRQEKSLGAVKEVTFKGNTYTDFNELVSAVEFGGSDFVINGGVLEKVNPTAEKIELPDSITAISDNAFDGCNRDLLIVYNGKNYNLANLDKLKEAVNGN